MKELLAMIVVSVVALCASTAHACDKCASSDTCDAAPSATAKPSRCTLSGTEFADRVSGAGFLAKRLEVRELEDGYAFRFPGDDMDLASHLAKWIVEERQCCSFLRFEMTLEADQGPIWVSVAGSREFKALIASLLESSVERVSP